MTCNVITKTQKNKKTKVKRVVVKTIPCDSFFNIFGSRKLADRNREKDDDFDTDDEDKLKLLVEEAHIISNDMYDLYSLYALEYYLGYTRGTDGECCEPDNRCFM